MKDAIARQSIKELEDRLIELAYKLGYRHHWSYSYSPFSPIIFNQLKDPFVMDVLKELTKKVNLIFEYLNVEEKVEPEKTYLVKKKGKS